MKRVLKWTAFLLGCGLLAWFIHRAGPQEILQTVRKIGWRTPLVISPFFFVYIIDTFGWYLAFDRIGRPAYRTLFRIRWASESVNNVLPSGSVGAEALKVYLLHKRGFPSMPASASVVTSKTCQVLAQVIYIALGAAAAMTHLAGRPRDRLVFLLVAVAATALIVGLFLLQRRGMFSSVHALFNFFSIRLKILDSNLARLRELDEKIIAFYRQDRPRFFRVTAAFLTGWFTDAWEVFLFCTVLHLPLAWNEAVTIEGFISVAKAVGTFVPGALGVQESGIVILFGVFGLPPPAAIAYAVVRRGRDVIYVLIGLVLLYFENASVKSLLASPPKESLAT